MQLRTNNGDKERHDQEIDALKLELSILQRSLTDSQKLTESLFTDKDRVAATLKKEVPHIYRRFQLDVFTENDLYKKRIITGMNTKLLSTASLLIKSDNIDKTTQTIIRDLKNVVQSFTVDEFGRKIELQMPQIAQTEVQTEFNADYQQI